MTFEQKEYVTLAVLFLISFFVWTLPMKESSLPFGEGDAVHQFAHAEYYALNNKATREMPFYLATWYAWENKKDFFGPINAPPFFVNVALMQALGASRFLAPYLYYAIIGNFVVVLAVYFLMRKLYGYWHAALSGFFLIFSFQNALSYVWGQRTILLAMSLIPLMLYCYYKYTESYYQKNEKKIYWYLIAVFLAIGSFTHPAMPFAAVSILGVYTVILIVKHRILPFNIKTIIMSIAIFVLLFGPFIADYKNQGQSGLSSPEKMPLSTLFYLYKHTDPTENPMMYSMETLIGGYWTVPLLLLGFFALLYRRNSSDLIMLSWFLGLYLILHIYILGFNPHVDRIVKGINHVLFPITVIGLLSIPSFFSVKKIRGIVRYCVIAVFVMMVILSNAKTTYNLMRTAYQPITRMNNAQLDAAQWIEKNIQESAVIYSLGSITYPKMRWLQVLSHHAQLPGMYLSLEQAENITTSFPVNNKVTHLLFDYSDAALLDNQQALQQLQQVENTLVGNKSKPSQLVYNQNNIKVYQRG